MDFRLPLSAPSCLRQAGRAVFPPPRYAGTQAAVGQTPAQAAQAVQWPASMR